MINELKGSRGSKMKPWLYVFALFFSQVALLLLITICCWIFPQTINLLSTSIAAILLVLMSGVFALGTVILIIRPSSVHEFLDYFDLRLNICEIKVISLLLGFCLGFAGVILSKYNLVDSSRNPNFSQIFKESNFYIKYFFALALIVFPFIEEIVMRGFIYRIFRDYYGILFSSGLVLLIVLVTHWSAMTASVPAFLILCIVQVVLCLIYEKTNCLWNSIICHATYNATLGIYDLLFYK
jgi:hypothetical protein